MCLTVSLPAIAQRRTTPAKTFPKPKTAVKVSPSKPFVIPDAEWRRLADALTSENWSVAADLAKADMARLPAENEKRQLAQLRYLTMFAMAGQILDSYGKGNTDETELLWTELDRVVGENIGKEVIMPARTYSADCAGKLNFICRVKDSTDELRTTATNREGTSIHSFDYVKFDTIAPALTEDGRKIFVGGVLKDADYNDDPKKPWALRLYFKTGFIVEGAP